MLGFRHEPQPASVPYMWIRQISVPLGCSVTIHRLEERNRCKLQFSVENMDNKHQSVYFIVNHWTLLLGIYICWRLKFMPLVYPWNPQKSAPWKKEYFTVALSLEIKQAFLNLFLIKTIKNVFQTLIKENGIRIDKMTHTSLLFDINRDNRETIFGTHWGWMHICWFIFFILCSITLTTSLSSLD